MRLELLIHPIAALALAESGGLEGDRLRVDGAALQAHLLEDRRLAAVDLTVASPGEACRIAPVFDVVEPRAKVGGGVNFPGALGPIRSAGEGQTRVLRGAAVVVLDPGAQLNGQNMVLDLSGPGAPLTRYSSTHN